MFLNPDHYCQSIKSKRLNPTNTKGTRIKTTTESGLSKFHPWDYSQDTTPNHVKALIDHANQLQWLDKNDYAVGSTKDGYVLVLIPKQD